MMIGRSVKAAILLSICIGIYTISFANAVDFEIPTDITFSGYGTNATLKFGESCYFNYTSTNNTDFTLICDHPYMDAFSCNISVTNNATIMLIVQVNATELNYGLTENHIFRDVAQKKYRFNSGFVMWIQSNLTGNEIIVQTQADSEDCYWLSLDIVNSKYTALDTFAVGQYRAVAFSLNTSQCIFLATPIDEVPFIILSTVFSITGIGMYVVYLMKKKENQCNPNMAYNGLTHRCELKPSMSPPK